MDTEKGELSRSLRVQFEKRKQVSEIDCIGSSALIYTHLIIVSHVLKKC